MPFTTPLPAAIDFHGLAGTGERMQELTRLVARVGRTDVTVLVTGESGTGKELVARALHAESRRAARPLLAVNCSALPSELVESELFGHVKGAFTGAMRDRPGLFEAADGGTLLLDEVGDLAVHAQAKALRALETGEIMPVGASRTMSVNVRVIAATNRPLDQLVGEGRFREDLLYRLQVITIALPPLRERPEDIPVLARRFIRGFAAQHGLAIADLTDEALAALRRWHWPGNVRELRNAIERGVILAEGRVLALHDLPQAIVAGAPAEDESPSGELTFLEARRRALHAFDRDFLAAALKRHGGNIARTARALGLHRQSLQRLLLKRELREGETAGLEDASLLADTA
ncbi:MAG TPA: sigma 54-interacting transcriptional regulator [Gemmatimonadales bacterium]|nr:sigma 54-interacting transcriptional regulator [Gemmatimonadales bacterium]